MKNIHKRSEITILVLFITGCSFMKPEAEVIQIAGANSESEGSEIVHLIRDQMEVMNIELGNFQYLNLSTTVKANGKLELPPQNKASLSAIIGCRIKNINVIEGDYVKQGQVLALLEHPDFIDLQEQYISLISQADFVEKNTKGRKGCIPIA